MSFNIRRLDLKGKKDIAIKAQVWKKIIEEKTLHDPVTVNQEAHKQQCQTVCFLRLKEWAAEPQSSCFARQMKVGVVRDITTRPWKELAGSLLLGITWQCGHWLTDSIIHTLSKFRTMWWLGHSVQESWKKIVIVVGVTTCCTAF